ncbi:MAG: TolC family protein [Cyclobacteriaceae bacterium]
MKKIVIIILFCFGNVAVGFSQSLDEYLHAAAENNPALKSYFNEYLAALEKVPQVGTLPDPQLSMGFFLQPMERFMGTQQADLQLMQMFPWFGMLKTQKDEASKMAVARYERFQEAKYDLFYLVKATWYELYRLEEEIGVTEENLDILQQLERLALIRFQSAGVGAGSGSYMSGTSNMKQSSTKSSSMSAMGGGMGGSTPPADKSNPVMSSPSTMGGGAGMRDVLRVRIEVMALENSLQLLKDSRIPLKAEFNQLLNRRFDEPVVVADTLMDASLSIERMAILDSITENSPMLKMLDAEAEAYELQRKMATLEGRPMIGAGLNYMPFSPRTENGFSMGGNDMVMPMVRLSIPVYRKKYTAMQREAELRQLAVQQKRENAVNLLAVEWSGAIRNLDDASRRIVLYQGQAELATQTLNLLVTGYTTDGSDFGEVLRVQQQLLDYHLSLITAIVDHHISIATLEKLAATELK